MITKRKSIASSVHTKKLLQNTEINYLLKVKLKVKDILPQTLNPNVQLCVAHSTSLRLDGEVTCLQDFEDPVNNTLWVV